MDAHERYLIRKARIVGCLGAVVVGLPLFLILSGLSWMIHCHYRPCDSLKMWAVAAVPTLFVAWLVGWGIYRYIRWWHHR